MRLSSESILYYTNCCYWSGQNIWSRLTTSASIEVQHPRSHPERFDLVIRPLHDCFSLTPEGKRRQIPFFLRPWETPREPPCRNVSILWSCGSLKNISLKKNTEEGCRNHN